MPFGKYKDWKMDNIAQVDPGYIRWVAENLAQSCRNCQKAAVLVLNSKITPEVPADLYPFSHPERPRQGKRNDLNNNVSDVTPSS
jgi:hypothetical protein